jgi:hypothetical protein
MRPYQMKFPKSYSSSAQRPWSSLRTMGGRVVKPTTQDTAQWRFSEEQSTETAESEANCAPADI